MSITKKILLSSLSAFTFLALPMSSAMADDIELTANVAVVSDYRFRGISLSDKDIAIQGGIDLGTKSGFYAGVWGSSIDTFAGSETEIDIYAGYGFEAGSLSYDVGVLAYTYPGSSDTLYLEGYGSVSGSFTEDLGWTVGAAYAYNQDNLGDNDNFYVYTDLEYAVSDKLSLAGHIASESGAFGKAPGTAKIDWSLGGTYAISDKVSLGVSYVDTNVSGLGKGGVVFTLGASF